MFRKDADIHIMLIGKLKKNPNAVVIDVSDRTFIEPLNKLNEKISFYVKN